MLSLDACVWGEAARLRRGLLSGEERGEGDSGGAHLSLHERYDEWFFGRPQVLVAVMLCLDKLQGTSILVEQQHIDSIL